MPVPMVRGLFAAAAVLVIAVVAVVAALAGAGPYVALGNSDPGLLVRLADPLLRACADIAAILCVGGLVFAVFFAVPHRDGGLGPRGYAGVVSAGRWASLWFVAAAVLVPVDASDKSGQPLSAVLAALAGRAPASDVWGSWAGLETPIAWLATALLALVVAVSARLVLRWQPSFALLAVAVCALLPPLVTDHSSSDTGHDLTLAAIVIHVPAAVVWIGALTALLRPRWRAGAPQTGWARRYRRLAWWCWLVLLVSGLVEAAVLVPVGQLTTTGYGRLLVAKLALVAALGALAVPLRRRALTQLAGGVAPRWRLAGAELILLAVTGAVSVGLTHLAPPAWVNQPVTIQQTLLGYNLAGPPTPPRLALDWRFDVLFGTTALALAAAYLLGVHRVRTGGGRWPLTRTASWLAGCVVLLVATSSGIGRYAPAMFSLHIASHMLLSMLAPILLALGAPLSLARVALPPDTIHRCGPRAWLDTLAGSRALAVLTHPLVALAVFAGAPFALYFTGLFDAAVRFHWAHLAIDAVFVAVGYLFAWTVIGPDPLPRPTPGLARLGILLAAMPFDIFFGVALINTHHVIGNGPAAANMYSALALPWVPNLLADQRTAGLIALAIGEACLLVAIAALLTRWHHLEHNPESDPARTLLAALPRRPPHAPSAEQRGGPANEHPPQPGAAASGEYRRGGGARS